MRGRSVAGMPGHERLLGRHRVTRLVRHANAPSIRVAARIGETLAGEVEVMGSMARAYEARR